jgi:hypothetical protein
MGSRGPVPKPSSQRRRKGEPVTRAPAGTWRETRSGRLVYQRATPMPVYGELPERVYHEVRLPPGIVPAAEPGEG